MSLDRCRVFLYGQNMAETKQTTYPPEEIKALLVENRIRQAELARALEVRRATVHLWLNGTTPVDKMKFLAIKAAIAEIVANPSLFRVR